MEHLTINEAVEYTGKSLSTIRRLVSDLKRQKSKHIKETYSNNGKKTITISIEAVRKLTGKNTYSNERSNDSSENSHSTPNEQKFIEHLQKEIEEKNKQISELLMQNNQFQHLLLSYQSKAIETGTDKAVKRKWWQRKN